MNCGRVQERLSDYLEGLLVSDEASRAAAHLRECAVCRGVREELVRFEEVVREVAAAQPVSPQLRERAISDWMGEREARHRSSYPGLIGRLAGAGGRWVPVTAVVLASILVAFVGLMLVHQPYGQTMRKTAFGRPSGTWTRELRPHAEAGGYSRGVPPGRGGAETEDASLTDGMGLRVAGREHPAPEADWSAHCVGTRHSGNPAGSLSFSRSVPAAHAPGDLPYLNGNPIKTASGWAKLSADEWGRIEAHVRRKVRVGDDFVQIPFPRIAAVTDRSLVAATEAYKREAAIVDTRLAREVTCAFKATALSDVCQRLRSDTGIQLTAGPSVADEKVTLFCEKQPLREVMRQLSRPFGYTWLRSRSASGVGRWALGSDPNTQRPTPNAEYRYELAQDLKSQLLEEELRNRDRNAALLALEKEIDRYRPYLAPGASLSPDEARARAKTAAPEEKKLLENLGGWGWGPLQLYSRLSPQDQAALRAGKRLSYSGDPQRVAKDGVQPLPPELDRGVLQSFPNVRINQKNGENFLEDPEKNVADGRPPTAAPEAHGFVSLKVGHSELGQFTLDGGSGVTVGSQITIHGHDLATGVSPAVQDPENEIANARLARDPALQARVTVEPGARRQALDASAAEAGRGEVADPTATGASRLASGASKKVTSADVLEALHRASGLPIVADFYTRLYPGEAVMVKNQPLFEGLNHLADAMHLHWKKDGSWLQFRSVSYYDDRVKEVPNRLLARWAASRKKQDGLPLDELIEMAQLSDAQLDSSFVTEGVEEWWGLEEWRLARNHEGRPHLRYLAQLTPAQRQIAMSATGLAFSQLSLAQQQRFIAHLDTRLESLEEVAGATLRVEYTQPGSFRWPLGEMPVRGQPGLFGLSLVREPSRAAALAAARRRDAGATEAQIAPTDLSLAVVYTLTDPRTGKARELGVRARADGGARISW